MRAGALTTVQDLGRIGSAHLGVPRAGAAGRARGAAGQPAGRQRRGRRGARDHADGVSVRVDRPRPSRSPAPPRRCTWTGAPSSGASPWTCRAGSVVEVGAGDLRRTVAMSPSPAASRSRRCSAAGRPTPCPASAHASLRAGQVLPLGDAAQPARRGVASPVPRPRRRRCCCACGAGPRRRLVRPTAALDALTGVDLHASRRRATGSARGCPAADRAGARDDGDGQRRHGRSARCRCRPTGSRSSSSPTTRPPAAIRSSASSTPPTWPRSPRPGPGPPCACAGSEPDMAAAIDLNSDLGEGFGVWRLGDDAGAAAASSPARTRPAASTPATPSTMRAVAAGAVAHGVAVGAQVSYRDLAGFGRRPHGLRARRADRRGALPARRARRLLPRRRATRVRYVKPHGALYNTLRRRRGAGGARWCGPSQEYDASLPVLGLPGSALLRLAEQAGPARRRRGVRRPRVHPGWAPGAAVVGPAALVTDPAAVVERAVRLATAGEVVAVDGSVLAMAVASLCVHGDTPGAVDLARGVREALEAAGVAVRRFADRPPLRSRATCADRLSRVSPLQ